MSKKVVLPTVSPKTKQSKSVVTDKKNSKSKTPSTVKKKSLTKGGKKITRKEILNESLLKKLNDALKKKLRENSKLLKTALTQLKKETEAKTAIGYEQNEKERLDIEQLRKQEYQDIKLVFEQSDIPSIVTNSDGKIISYNKAAFKLTGYSFSETPDFDTFINNLFPNKEYQLVVRKKIAEAFSGKERKGQLDFTILTKKLDKRKVLLSISCLPQKDFLVDLQFVQILDLTDKQNAESQSAQQKYLIDQLMQSVPDLIYFKDLQSRFLTISNSFCKRLNISSPDEIIGKTDFDIYDFEHAQDAFNDEQQIISTGKPIVGKEEKELWFNKEEHWSLTTKMPWRDSNGFTVGTFGISRDITEIIKGQTRIKESEIRYRKLIESSPFAILVHQNGKVVFANEACAKMVHAGSLSEVIGKNLFDFMPPEFTAISKQRVKLIAEGIEKVPTFELKYNCLDGDIIDIDATAIPIVYDGTNSILVIANDVTEKNAVKRKLAETEERFRVMFDNHSAIMMLVDSETGDIKNVNEATTKFYGYSKQELLSMKISNLNTLPSVVISEFMKKSQSQDSNYFVFKHKLANNELRDVEVYACPIDYDGHKFLFSVIHDITERKKAEELSKENEELLKKAQKIANVGHYVLNVKAGKWTCSEQMDLLLGMGPDIEKNLEIWVQGIYETDREMMVDYFYHNVLQNHQSFDHEYRITRLNDNEVRWVHGLGDLRFDENGNVSEMFGTIQDITEWKITELDLLKTQFSVDKAKDMVYWISADGKISYVNDAACKVTGYTRQEFQSMTIFDIDPAFPRHLWEEHWNESRILGSKTVETIHQTKTGIKIPVEVSIDFMNYGGVEYHCSYARDITERKKAQEELQESEARYKAILEYSPYSLMVHQNEKITFANNASVELLGANSSDELIGKSIWDIVHSDYRSIMNDTINEATKAHKAAAPVEEKFIRCDGKTIDVETISVPFSVHGVPATLFITRFIGDLKEKNERLRKLQRAVEQSSAGIMIANRDGIIEYVNPKFTEITGYSYQETISSSTRLLKSGYHDSSFYQNLWITILHGNEWRGELKNKKKSGELYWEYDSISSIKNDSGEITHFLAIKEDITVQKKIQEDILIAKEEAEEANKVKSSLLANMSHEFRTPLNGILGFTQLLKDFEIDEEVAMMIQKIEKSGKRLMSTLNAVLSLTELETEDFIVQENEVDLVNFCAEIKTMFERTARDRNLLLDIDLRVHQLNTVIDESLLSKIVSGICDNAVKYTNTGSVTIQLTEPITKDGINFARINIIDTGIGIKKENQQIIFKEFRQLSEGIRRDFEGLGLGLTLAKRMARLIEAEIIVESEYGKGSTFSILFPIKSNPTDRYSQELEFLKKSYFTKPTEVAPSNQLNILLVEDNPLNIEVVQRFLSKVGNVKAARDGKSALKLAADECFDLLLIDINLGSGIDGTEVLRQLRMQENYKHTPSVALTGYASETNKREFLAQGFTGYLAKPFEKKVLINLLKELV